MYGSGIVALAKASADSVGQKEGSDSLLNIYRFFATSSLEKNKTTLSGVLFFLGVVIYALKEIVIQVFYQYKIF